MNLASQSAIRQCLLDELVHILLGGAIPLGEVSRVGTAFVLTQDGEVAFILLALTVSVLQLAAVVAAHLITFAQ